MKYLKGSYIDVSKSDINDVIRAGDVAKFKILVNKLSSIDEKNEQGWTTLMKVSMHNHSNLVQILIDKKASINMKEVYGTNSLMFASRLGNYSVVQTLLDNGADVNDQNNHGTSALMFASENNHLSIVNLLIDRGANVNLITKNGETALSQSHKNCESTAISELLIHHGANIYFKDSEGYIKQMENSNTDPLRTLSYVQNIKINQENNFRIQEYVNRLFFVCSESGLVSDLLNAFFAWKYLESERPKKINYIKHSQKNLLMIAVGSNFFSIAEELLISDKLDIPINEQDTEGNTALHIACVNNNIRFVKLLLHNQADWLVRNKQGQIPSKLTNEQKIVRIIEFHQNLKKDF